MTKDDIIRMAREADLVTWGFESLEWEPVASMEAIERFAALVASAEREACAKWLEDVVDAPNWAEAIRAREQA